MYFTAQRPADAEALNEWSYHTSDLSQVTDPNSVSRQGRLLGQLNTSNISSFNPSSSSSPRPRRSSSNSILQQRHVQIALSESTQLDSTVFESFSGGASNLGFQDDVDQMEMRVRSDDNDSGDEVIVFERTTTMPV